MSTRSNGGIIGPQNRTTSAYANGVWHLYDNQQSVYSRNWPGFVPVAPSAPAVGTVTLGSGTQAAYLTATIPFTQGYNGGNTVTSVTAISIPGGLTASTAGTSPITISGLSQGTNYTFGVYETNFYGNSPFGYSNPVTTAAVPSTPTIGTATKYGSINANVTFTASSSNGGAPITGYTSKAYFNSNNAYSGINASNTASPISVTGLTGNTTYYFKVYATNVMGNSSESAASNTITTDPVISINYLVVAGGGGAGGRGPGGGGGGGGAGGMLTGTGAVNLGQTYVISVGSGGAGGAGASQGSKGNDSNIAGLGFSVASTGGGFGGYGTASAGSGGSGGGGNGSSDPTPGAGTSGQGNSGGAGFVQGNDREGGGGGAGTAGQAATANSSGNGGDGATSNITGSSIYYAGGGAGGFYNTPITTIGTGGLGGGGNVFTNGTVNTGGGGGGGTNSNSTGGSGGSGIVIVSTSVAFTLTTGSPTVTTVGSNTVYKWTGNGSFTV